MSLPTVCRTIAEWRTLAATLPRPLGFVPTMGALHQGHVSLMQRASAECGSVLVSVYVNPTQFDNPDDLAKYPATWESDLALCETAGVDAVFAPMYAELYPDRYRYRVTESDLSTILEGAHRPGHFDGVLTVVLKFFNIAGAERAYFGEKDWQQLLLVIGMCDALHHPTRIVPCPTVREADGLAMSSRNRRLNPAQRALAAQWAALLADTGQSAESVAAQLSALGFDVDYVADHGGRRLGAVRVPTLGGGDPIRLIDNVALPGRA